MNGPATLLVKKSSATHGRPWETGNNFVRPFDTDHSGLVKFPSLHDEHYLTVLSILRDLMMERKEWGEKQPDDHATPDDAAASMVTDGTALGTPIESSWWLHLWMLPWWPKW